MKLVSPELYFTFARLGLLPLPVTLEYARVLSSIIRGGLAFFGRCDICGSAAPFSPFSCYDVYTVSLLSPLPVLQYVSVHRLAPICLKKLWRPSMC